MMKRAPFFILAIISLTLSGCYRDEESIDTDYVPDPPGKEVVTHLTGTVQRVDGSIVPAVSVSADGIEVRTGNNGYFDLDKVRLSEDEGTLVLNKPGYFPFRWSIRSIAGQTHDLEPVMIPLGAIKDLTTSGSQTFELKDRIKVEILQGSLIDPQTGNVFQGDFRISIEELGSRSLGSLFGDGHYPVIEDIHLKKELILPDRCFLIAVTKPDGQELLLNTPANITLDLAVAGNEPQIFTQTDQGSFREVIPETVNDPMVKVKSEFLRAILIGSSVPAKVVSGKISIDGAVPASFTNVTVEGNSTVRTRTTNEGSFRMWTPDDFESLHVTDECGNTIYSEDLSPGSSDVQVDIPLSYDEYLFYSGSIEKCAGEKVSSGFLKIQDDEGTIAMVPVDAQGYSRFFLMTCNQSDIFADIFENGSSDPLARTDLPSQGQWTNRKLITCSSAPSTEAVINVDGQQYYYNQCKADLYQDDQDIVRIRFTVTGPSNDEIHLFLRETKSGTDYWRSPVKITPDNLVVVNIPKNPQIDRYEISGIRYMTISWSHVLLQTEAGENKRGEFRYTFEWPR